MKERLENTCLNCNERHTNCHSECEKYIKWKNERDIKQGKIRASKVKYWEINVFKSKQVEKTMKRKRR